MHVRRDAVNSTVSRIDSPVPENPPVDCLLLTLQLTFHDSNNARI